MTPATPPVLPTLQEMRAAADSIAPYVLRTPVHRWRGHEIEQLVGAETEVWLKLELLQYSGTFKARGVVSNLLALDAEQLRRGVTAMSAGNHAVAVAWAARQFGIKAKVVMQASANPARLEAARGFGAEVVLAADGPTGFAMAERIAADEGLTFVHPFDGLRTALGTASLGLEFAAQVPSLDAIIVAVGGGGLAGGVACAIKAIQPNCVTIGVEPEGADAMHRSFVAGSAQRLAAVHTIADSLAPPMALPFTYALCRSSLDELVHVSDQEMIDTIGLLFRDMKLAVEPAGAAATAALVFRLRERLRGKRLGIVVCGANLDASGFSSLLGRAGPIRLHSAK